MARLRVLIAAAGVGSRSGLSYPKTLHPVFGRPILVRLIELLRAYDPLPVVIVSPAGRATIASCLNEYRLDAELVDQPAPTGMGDAVLRFRQSSGWGGTEHLLTVWGDIPLLEEETVAGVHAAHFEAANDFTLATRIVDEAYTIVERDSEQAVRGVIETRETAREISAGERDIGLFLFKIDPVFDLLEQRLPDGIGKTTGEHGFLYIVRHLVERGCRVQALPIATELDLISLNRLADIADLEDGLFPSTGR